MGATADTLSIPNAMEIRQSASPSVGLSWGRTTRLDSRHPLAVAV